MSRADPPARVAALTTEELTAEASAFLAHWSGDSFRDPGSNPVLRTFAHHPQLAEAFSTFNVHILAANSLPLKLRQIAIMRTAWLTGAVYMWSSHLKMSMDRGLSDDMFGPIQAGPNDPYFNDLERDVMRATEELVRDRRLADVTWDHLRAAWSVQQILDFLFTVGCYVMIAGVMRTIGVERMPDLIEIGERYGAPPSGQAV